MENSRTALVRSYSIWLGAFAAGLIALAIILSWISSGFVDIASWSGFLVILVAGSGMVAAIRWALRGEPLPDWLIWLTLGAALLRLLAGVVWYTVLPAGGYKSDAELAGYVMADAYERDSAAWELAQSGKPLNRAFQGSFRKADQYGGLLYISAGTYRFLGGGEHQPLLIVVLTAFFSSLSIFFTWALANRLWGPRSAHLAALILALYPEAILLGSSQMREPFTITFFIMACYGLVRFLQDGSGSSLVWTVAGLILSIPFSPPFAGLLFIFLILLAFGLGGEGIHRFAWRDRRMWLGAFLLGGLILAAVWLAWRSFAPQDIGDPIGVIRWWVRRSTSLQAHLSERASGWVQKIFDATPSWSHIPMLVLYGVIQPFLPAAIADVSGAIIWRAIAIWRAVGWALLLPFLILAPLASLRNLPAQMNAHQVKRRLVLFLSLIIWLGILIASYRGGGDQWDNPRYRAAFTGLQVILVAWVWTRLAVLQSVWIKRALVSSGIILGWFLAWYLRRYIYLPWPVDGFFSTLVLGIASAALYIIGDWAGQFEHRPRG